MESTMNSQIHLAKYYQSSTLFIGSKTTLCDSMVTDLRFLSKSAYSFSPFVVRTWSKYQKKIINSSLKRLSNWYLFIIFCTFLWFYRQTSKWSSFANSQSRTSSIFLLKLHWMPLSWRYFFKSGTCQQKKSMSSSISNVQCNKFTQR